MRYLKNLYVVTSAAALFLGSHLASAAILEAVEFYNAPIRHYFLTTNSVEAAGIEAGAAGAGWSRTGGSFSVYSLSTDGLGDTVPVCRFYARGPNSHFFTANKFECADLRAAETQQRQSAGAAFQGWGFEGIAFYAVAAPNGFCPAGRAPVYRFYNQRGAQNDSNHRFTTEASAGAVLVSAGWKEEGVAFCSLKATTAPPNSIDSTGECGVTFPLTRALTYEIADTGLGPGGGIETTTRRAVSRNTGPARFADQDVLAIASYNEAKPEDITYAMFALSDTDSAQLGSRAETAGLVISYTHTPATRLPRKWVSGQSIANSYQVTTRYGNIAAEPVAATETVSFLRNESVNTPAGVFTNACVIRSRLTYPQVSTEIIADSWLVAGIGTVKSAAITTRAAPGATPIVSTSESILVSAQ